MKVKELIVHLLSEDMEDEVFVFTKDGSGACVDGILPPHAQGTSPGVVMLDPDIALVSQ